MLPNKLVDTYRGVFGSYVFRFISGYAFWLSISVFLLLGIIYSLYARDIYRDIEQQLDYELGQIHDHYVEGGVLRARQYVQTHGAEITAPKLLYSLLASDGELHGNVGPPPVLEDFEFAWAGLNFQTFNYQEHGQDLRFAAVTRGYDDGSELLVGLSLIPAEDKIQLMFDLLLRGTVVTILLGVIGGAVISSKLLRQVEAFNTIIRKILAGDLSKRLPINRYSGDFREMEININKMLDRLQELMAGVRRVSDNIAHDLRTPLTRLRNHVAQLELSGGGHKEEIIASLSTEADELLATFNAALKIAQIETGNRQSEFNRHDFTTTILDVIELYEPVAAEKRIRISDNLPREASIEGDRDLLFQVVANLLDNAIKYTGEGGLIEIILQQDADRLKLQFRDNGIGIPLADRHRVFERFFRVEASRSEYPGNGLGLSLVAAVVDYHQGKIDLYDNNPGLCVSVDLPRST